jgi:hypothetical protein
MDAKLLAESRRLLDRARMIAEAPAAQATEVGRGHPQSQEPAGAFTYSTSTLEACGWRINAAIAHDSDTELRAANLWATREIDALQHGSKKVAETPLEFQRRIVRDYEGVTAPDVAREERSSVSLVRAARVKHGRTGRFGHKLAEEGSDD